MSSALKNIACNSIVDVLIYENNKYTVLSWRLHEDMSAGYGVLVPYKDKTIKGIVLGKTENISKTTARVRRTLQSLGPQTSRQLLNMISTVAKKNLSEVSDYYKLIVPKSYYSERMNPESFLTSESRSVKNENNTVNTNNNRRTHTPEPVLGSEVKIKPEKTSNIRIFNIIQPVEKKLLEETIKYIDKSLQYGQVLVLLPSLNYIENLYQKLPQKLKTTTIMLPRARYSEIENYVKNKTRVALGTRNNVLQYGIETATLIIVEENHIGHRYMSRPYVSTRVIAKERIAAGSEKLYYISSNPSPAVLTRNVKTLEIGYKGYNTKLVDLTELPYSERTSPKTILAEIKKLKKNKKILKIAYYNTISKRETALQKNIQAVTLNFKNPHAQEMYDVIIIDNIDKILEKPTLQPGCEARRHINSALNQVDPSGLIVIITSHKTHPILQSYVQKNQLLGLKWQHNQARKYNLPPYGKIVVLESKHKKHPQSITKEFHGGLETKDKKSYIAVFKNAEYENYKMAYKKNNKILPKIF